MSYSGHFLPVSERAYKEVEEIQSIRNWSDRTSGFPWTEGRIRSDIGKKFLPVRVVRPWHRVPRAAVAAPGSLAGSKARLDGAWSSLGHWKVSLPMAGAWN